MWFSILLILIFLPSIILVYIALRSLYYENRSPENVDDVLGLSDYFTVFVLLLVFCIPILNYVAFYYVFFNDENNESLPDELPEKKYIIKIVKYVKSKF